VRTHFDNVGFSVPDRGRLTALIRRTAREGSPLDSPHGRYYRWAPGAGIELWVGVDANRELTAFNPHLSGQGRLMVRVDRTERDRQAPMNGRTHGWAVRDGRDLFGVVIDVPDFDFLQAEVSRPATLAFQVAAFAHELHVFEDEAAFLASGADRPPRSFEPVPMEEDEPERTDFLIAGLVVRTELRENPVTGARFHWALVDTVGGTVDLVADPEVMSGPPVEGSVAYGEFWLSGRAMWPGD